MEFDRNEPTPSGDSTSKAVLRNTRRSSTDEQLKNHVFLREQQPHNDDGEPTENNHNRNDNDDKMKPSQFLFFAANSTFHGMSHIFTPGQFTLRKALWGLAFVCSLSLFLIQACDRYKYYQERPHVTKLDEKEVEEMTFPAVTICNMNPFRVKEITADDYFYAGEHILEIFDPDYNLRTSSKFNGNAIWQGMSNRINSVLKQKHDYRPEATTFNISEFYDRTGHKLTGIVKQCKYRGNNCMSLWNTVYTRYGKCYTFNGGPDNGKLLTTLKGGVDNGLEVLLDTEQDNYMPVWAESDEISVEAGFKVQIHSQDEPPFIHELGFGISPGFQRLVATQEQRITFLPYPYGDCESGSDGILYFPYVNYSISACRIRCETDFVVSRCDCRMVHMPGNAPFCSPEMYKKCADKYLDMLVQTDEKQCVCKTPCTNTRYNLEMSSLRLPSTQALTYMAYKYNKSEEYVKKNFAKMNIFFEALNYETIEQKKTYEIPGLLGDIGGQMGLFIGASILTILEIFDYVYEVIKEKVRRKGKKKIPRNHTIAKHSTENDAPTASHQTLPAYNSQLNGNPSADYHLMAELDLGMGSQMKKEEYFHDEYQRSPFLQQPMNSSLTLPADDISRQYSEAENLNHSLLISSSSTGRALGRPTSCTYPYREPATQWSTDAVARGRHSPPQHSMSKGYFVALPSSPEPYLPPDGRSTLNVRSTALPQEQSGYFSSKETTIV